MLTAALANEASARNSGSPNTLRDGTRVIGAPSITEK
jgi:hypothetical protein